MKQVRAHDVAAAGDSRPSGATALNRMVWVLLLTAVMASWSGVARADAGPVLPGGLAAVILIALGAIVVGLTILALVVLRRVARETRAQESAGLGRPPEVGTGDEEDW